MSKLIWAFAIEPFAGAIHIIPHAMPPAENLVNVRIRDDGGVYVIDAADARALRELLGVPSIREVIRHTGPAVADELESMLEGIETLVRKRIARNRPQGPEDDEEDGPSPP